MAGFLYFFPHSDDKLLQAGKLNPVVLERCGLKSVFSEQQDASIDCEVELKCTGPEGLQGTLVYYKPVHGGKSPHGGFNATSQLWFDRGEFWIGVEKGNEPKPRDLERRAVYPAFNLTDRHGNRWQLPTIRMPDGRGSIPVEYGFSKEGEVIHRVCREFRDAWDLAGEALDMLRAGAEERQEKWPESKQVRMAVDFLSINYRVSIHEMAAMYECDRAVLDTELAVNCFMAVTNWPVWVEYMQSKGLDEQADEAEKKKTAAASVAA